MAESVSLSPWWAWIRSGGLAWYGQQGAVSLPKRQRRKQQACVWQAAILCCVAEEANLNAAPLWHDALLLRHAFALHWLNGDENNSGPTDIWKSEYAKYFYGCSVRSATFPASRLATSISFPEVFMADLCLYFEFAYVYNVSTDATVVPELDHNYYWKDDSDFVNIFDVDWFISYLAKDVTVVKRVPDKFMRSMEKPPYTMRVPRKSPPEYYLDQVLPILKRRHVLQLTKFDYRLANNIDEDLQKLRCRANFHALRFTEPIQALGQKLVRKMRQMANLFMAVHLRLEPDMLAFSGCYIGGGDKERYKLREIRKRWETLPHIEAVGERRRGKCPLTPHEVGLMLRALGFENDTYIYVASGEIYEILANEGLKPFLPFSSCLAAIDYIVCDESVVFVTNNNGNMAKILAGRRRYMGHKRTIRPNAKRLSTLLMERDQMDWDTFAEKVKAVQRGFMGEPDEMRAGRGEFHEYPYSCICEKPGSDIIAAGNNGGGDGDHHQSQQFKENEGLRKRSNEEEEPVLGAKEDGVFPD
ncbi:hypothetical protein CXB51_030466 [Gossypium anomalum]|uniref:O-fucosyltransferase family protein n=1 Tax=Gossypium anomalum TaxID=47600 RepID=A0A8J5YBJ5_9ROSI|nr:hypothetical protein CXB51_030466 [Gossypium anomalum]